MGYNSITERVVYMTKEDLQQIAELLKPINERLDRIQEDLEATKELSLIHI